MKRTVGQGFPYDSLATAVLWLFRWLKARKINDSTERGCRDYGIATNLCPR